MAPKLNCRLRRRRRLKKKGKKRSRRNWRSKNSTNYLMKKRLS